MEYENLVRNHFQKLLQENPGTIMNLNGGKRWDIVLDRTIKNKLLIHCLLKIEGGPENAQKILEQITLESVKEIVDYPQYIYDAEATFNTLSQLIKKST